MKPSLLQELTLYRYRYFIAYGLVAILTGALLLTAIGSVPNGLRETEMTSAVASNSIDVMNIRSEDIVNLPYHLLQKASITLLGLSPLSVRLPSVVLGFITCIVIAVTLNVWFRKNIAVIALLIAITSTPFITMSRVGTAGIFYTLLLVTIMLSAALLTIRARGTFVWKLLAVVAGLLLLYIPLGIYALSAMLIAGLLHPHVRHQIKRTTWWQYLIIILFIGLLLTPVVITSVNDSQALVRLLGLTDLQAKLQLETLRASVIDVTKNIFYFTKPMIGTVIVPYLSLTFMLLVAFGLVKTIIDRHSARSYLLHLWLLLSVPLLILNPTSFPLLFVPCLFLMAIGLETFMREWYTVFPKNPYARISALIPVTLIVLGLISASTSQYFYGFYYSDARTSYRPELRFVSEALRPQISTLLIVPKDEIPFYDILRSTYPQLKVKGATATIDEPAAQYIVLARSGYQADGQPTQIVSSSYKTDDVMLRVYERGR